MVTVVGDKYMWAPIDHVFPRRDHVWAISGSVFSMLSWLDWMDMVTVVGAKYAWAQFDRVFPCGYGSCITYFESCI